MTYLPTIQNCSADGKPQAVKNFDDNTLGKQLYLEDSLQLPQPHQATTHALPGRGLIFSY
jgi:hypothetical protein